jgi:TPP-dependent pyruvate/acetoin dehydrogenase alpha subunit
MSDSDSEMREAVVRLRSQMLVLNEILKGRPYEVPVHNALGQECVPVALRRLLRGEDQLYLTHRNVAYNLVWSSGLAEVLRFYELSHDEAILHMGGMNLALPGSPVRYVSSILGNNLPVATGGALSLRNRRADGVSCAITGDGAIEEGAFFESLLFASSHGLPLVVIVENNDHSMTSRIRDRRCALDLPAFAGSMGVTCLQADGSTVDDVHRRLNEAIAEARTGRPVLVEVVVETFNQHAGPTPGFPGDQMVVDIADGIVLGPSSVDPVARIRDELGGVFEPLAAAMVEESSGGG